VFAVGLVFRPRISETSQTIPVTSGFGLMPGRTSRRGRKKGKKKGVMGLKIQRHTRKNIYSPRSSKDSVGK